MQSAFSLLITFHGKGREIMIVKNKTPVKYTKPIKKKEPIALKMPDRDKSRGKSLEKLREELFERRNSLRRNMNSDESVDTEAIVQVGDSIDAALEATENEMEYHFYEAESREFGQIERAIKRFEEGTYGTCEGCGSQIPIARLKVLPFACKCVKCQQLDEEEQNRSSFRGWRSYDYSAAPSTTSSAHTDYEFQD